MDTNIIKIYADGSCLGNPGPGGYAAILMYGENTKTISGGEMQTTNNRMELTAVIMALKEIKTNKIQINMFVDSKYVYDGITQYVPNWQKNGWKTSTKQEVKNQDLWQQLCVLNDELKVCRNHVFAHKDDHLNNLVDQIARKKAQSFIN